MPKEIKSDPLFCCGELHKSANYHKRTVHQKYTKIYFKDHPDANFLLRRNPKTQLFHCPQCDKSWAMATPVRNHILKRCEGYVKYRSPVPRTSVENEAAGSGQSEHVKDEAVVLVKAEPVEDAAGEMREREVPEPGAHEMILSTPSPTFSMPCLASSSNPTPTPELRLSRSASSDSPPASSEPTAHPCAVLRPALWSPISITSSPGTPGSRPPVSVHSSLAGSTSSRASVYSTHTWPDDHPSGNPLPSPRLKIENEWIMEPLTASGSVSGHRSSPRLASHPPSPSAPSAARMFLDGLRRPLGHAAPQLHALGVVSEADLDLICTMPEVWDEVGELLMGRGVTVIEWLMVKEAFKGRAKHMSAVME